MMEHPVMAERKIKAVTVDIQNHRGEDMKIEAYGTHVLEFGQIIHEVEHFDNGKLIESFPMDHIKRIEYS